MKGFSAIAIDKFRQARIFCFTEPVEVGDIRILSGKSLRQAQAGNIVINRPGLGNL